MEIPYIFTPRKDTGMVNSKIAIWLFLASEVMLFGGFFSSYVYLRLGADYPWPERALPVLPGLINTFVLIASSVTVVFAWAALKLRKWFAFQISMAFTILCALVFMVLKGFEYNVKWHHQAIRLTDYTILEGHLGYDQKADTGKKKKDGTPLLAEADQIHITAEKLTFSTTRFHEPWVKEMIRQVNALPEQSYLSATTNFNVSEVDGKITGIIINDANGNGVIDLPEENKKGEIGDNMVPVELINSKNEVVAKSYTYGDAEQNIPTGTYSFDKIAPGAYTIKFPAKLKPRIFLELGVDKGIPYEKTNSKSADPFSIDQSLLDKNFLGVVTVKKNELGDVSFEPEIVESEIPLIKDSLSKLISNTKNGESKTFHYVKSGAPLSIELLDSFKSNHLESKAHNSSIRTDAFRKAWKDAWALEENAGKKGWQLAPNVKVPDAIVTFEKLDTPSVTFAVSPASNLWFTPRDVKEGAESSKLRDDTIITGKLQESPVDLHNLDAIDFRHVVMQAEKKGIDPIVAIENTWIIKNSKAAREAWEWNKEQTAKLADRLRKDYGLDETGAPKRVPTDTEKYRIGWKDFVSKANNVDRGQAKIDLKEEFLGPNYEAREAAHTFPHLSVPRELVFLSGKFTPAWNTYYAIYFTMTALHGLHVIGGAIVLGYYLFCGKKMYRTNPEWLANRVEVGGLFWHFVDLVWIFLFPILYLM